MIDQSLGHYRVIGKLGVGGMGVVYEAHDARLSRRVALKFLPEELAGDAEAIRRFEREAQTIALLNHPHICTIYNIDSHEGRRFIAMECLTGVTLRKHMAESTLETAGIVDIAAQITSALEATHAQGIVHRDIKPGNIFVNETGQVKVLDFGLARRFQGPETGAVMPGGSTIPGRPVGTVNYMAPERILQLPLDPRSDLFSLGVVIYEMATGKQPFAGATPSETVTNILESDPVSLTTLSADRPIEMECVVNRLIAKRPEERYQSARSLLDDLAGLANARDSSPASRMLRRLFSW